MQIWKQLNKKEKKYYWHARFRINKTTFRPKAETKDDLDDLITDIKAQEKTEKDNKKFNLNRTVPSFIPTVEELLIGDVLPTITNEKQNQIAGRVFGDFIALLPPELKVSELTTFHFQLYINDRRKHISKQTKEKLKPQTINKEIFYISGGLKEARNFYEALQNWTRPPINFLAEEDSARELNLEISQFYLLLKTLRKERTGRQTVFTETHRRRLADELEFRFETGLRLKEVSRLEFKQYIERENILKNVRRWKTKTVTKIFPLTERAVEIIEARREAGADSKFIFTTDGEPVASDYRTLKTVCADLDISYGRYTEAGFVPHDLRHAAGTEIVRVTDIESARIYLGHSNIKQTTAYLHTDAERLKEAVRKRDELKKKKIDVEKALKSVYKKVKNNELDETNFIENIRRIFNF